MIQYFYKKNKTKITNGFIEAHESDFDIVMKRGREYGVEKYLFAAGYIGKIWDVCGETRVMT